MKAITLMATALMSLGVLSATAQSDNTDVGRRALTHTGSYFAVGPEMDVANRYVGVGLNMMGGIKIVPQFMAGIGIRPTATVDDYFHPFGRSWLEYDFSDRHYEREYDDPTVFFSIPIYAFVKYDFMNTMVSPFVTVRGGAMIEDDITANYYDQHDDNLFLELEHKAHTGVYANLDLGVRIALRVVTISPYIGYRLNGVDQTKGKHGMTLGVQVEF